MSQLDAKYTACELGPVGRWIWGGVLAATLGAAGTAGAQEQSSRALVWTVGGHEDFAQSADVRDAVSSVIDESGLRPLGEAELALVLPPHRLAACPDVPCVRALAADLSVSLVAAVAVWAPTEAEPSVVVTLLVGADRSYGGRSPTGDDRGAAARAATLEAVESWRNDATGAAPPVPAEAPEPVTADDAPAPDRRTNPLNDYVFPLIVVGTGAALLAFAVVAFLPVDCEFRARPDGPCLVGERGNTGLGLAFTALGGLSLAGGLLWLIAGLQPVRLGDMDVVQGPGELGLGLRGRL